MCKEGTTLNQSKEALFVLSVLFEQASSNQKT